MLTVELKQTKAITYWFGILSIIVGCVATALTTLVVFLVFGGFLIPVIESAMLRFRSRYPPPNDICRFLA